MLDSTFPILKSWEAQIASNGGEADIKVDDDLRNLSADVISRACFGSSYGMGNEIFKTLGALKVIIAKKNFIFGIPSFSYLPTKKNREIWKLEKKVKSSVLKIVKQCTKDPMSSKDLLMTILKNANSSQLPPGASNQFIVSNCKNFYFAGHDTTATAAQWILVLLASYPEWQMHARAEVVEVCGDKLPNPDSIGKMKMLTMVIQECLRLCPPSAFVAREAIEELKLGDLNIPKGTHIWVPIAVMHRDTRIWGHDVNEFRPDRFKNGISGACNLPIAYMPFGMGPRTCVGQHLAMVELKIILCLILSKFSFSLSPKYKHSPQARMLVEPGYGVYLLIKKI
ncbi:Cytochrome p450 [Thalictrum thalictroides]|uniref:Cytochrome p450 n=1 Tax=Thalictrum thalictroides TaxID=46969 RepID=A0A7J6X194_THATH|nr:Cytochrome p450 [Thalictrum thalictroides]